MASPLPSPVSFAGPANKEALFAWTGMFLRTLNKFVQQTVTALQEQRASGPAYRALSIPTGAVAADAFPILIDNPLDRQPSDVHVAKVTPEGTDALLGPVTVLWSLTSEGQILISSVTGLDVSSSYEVALSVS